MFKSIQWTLQLWHAGLLAAVLIGFGTASYYGISQMRYQDVDAQLEQAVQTVAARLNPGPPDGRGGGGRGGGRGGGGRPDDRRQFDPNRQGPDSNFNQGGPPPNNMDAPGGSPNGNPGDFNGPPGGGGGNFGGPYGGPGGGGGGGGGRGGFGGGPGGPGGGGGGGGFGGGGGRGQDFGPRNGPNGPGGGPRGPDLDRLSTLDGQFGDGQNGTLYYTLFGFDGEVLRSSSPAYDIPAPPALAPQNNPPMPDTPHLRQRGDLREAYLHGPFGMSIVVGRSLAAVQSQLHNTGLMLGASGAGVLFLGLFGGWLLSRRAVRPIQAITAVAQNISASNLSRRIDLTDFQSEFGTLASVLNETFARLESAFQQQVRFTADASHELRTPLAVIHTHAQLALSRERSAEEYKKSIATCLRASNRMKSLVDSLLLLASADAGRLTLNPQPFELQDIVEECITMVAPLAQEKKISLEADLQPVELTADPTRIAQVLINLLTNAIRYNREGGSVQVSLKTDGQSALLTVTDTGVGIPPEHQPHVFERFYRVDKARSREAGGSGLGLAICKNIIDAHGGTITLQSEADVGTTFIVRLPLSAPEGHHKSSSVPSGPRV